MRKITKLKVARTEKQENDAWDEVFSHRNKLLATSNWTMLPDSGLTERNVQLWTDWRMALRRVNRRNFADRELAANAIKQLEKAEPREVYEDESIFLLDDNAVVAVNSIQDRKDFLLRTLSKRFNDTLDAGSFESNPTLLAEQFEEALLYNPNQTLAAFPLINLECELTGKTPEDVVEYFISQKRLRLRMVLALKRKFAYFRDAINAAPGMIELVSIERDIKEWTLTLT